jgi:hypothetical protein
MHAFVLLAHFCHLGHVKRVFVATLVLGITHLQNVLDLTISQILERARVLHAQPAAATIVLANSSLIVANAPMDLCWMLPARAIGVQLGDSVRTVSVPIVQLENTHQALGLQSANHASSRKQVGKCVLHTRMIAAQTMSLKVNVWKNVLLDRTVMQHLNFARHAMASLNLAMRPEQHRARQQRRAMPGRLLPQCPPRHLISHAQRVPKENTWMHLNTVNQNVLWWLSVPPGRTLKQQPRWHPM